MKKISKLLLSPLPIVAALPTMAFATSCGNVDYDKALTWFDEKTIAAKEAFEATPMATESLKIALNQVREIERSFITLKVPYYWIQTVANLREDLYNKEKANYRQMCTFYGHTSDEREQYLELKENFTQLGQWIVIETRGNYTDGFFKSFDNDVAFYQMITCLNANVNNCGYLLRDVVGWGGHIACAAYDIKYNVDPSKRHFTDYELFADVDGANVGYLYSKMNEEYKSPTLALYTYYTNLTDSKSRIKYFYKNVLNVDPDASDEEKFDAIAKRLNNSFYFRSYIDEFLDLNIKYDVVYLANSVRAFIGRLNNLMV